MLFRKGKGARCPEELANNDSEDAAVEAEGPDEDADVGLLCLDEDEGEDGPWPEGFDEPPASAPAGAAASTAPSPLPRMSQLERLAAIRLVYGRRPPPKHGGP